MPPGSDHAVSPVIGVLLMIGIAFILAMLVLLLCLGFQFPRGDADVPAIFRIVRVNHLDDNGKLDFNSFVILKNTGTTSFRNRYLHVRLLVNGAQVNCNLMTLNGEAFCSSNHYGVQNIGGPGTRGNMVYTTARWYEDQEIFIDFSDGTFRPGDAICIEIYDSMTGRIISRDTYPENKKYTTRWFYNYFLNPQAA
jgi:flagellin-like protein